MDKPDLSKAQQIAQVARAFELQATGQLPSSVAVVLSEDTLVITLRETLSPAEAALAKRPDGAAQLREFHRQLFTIASGPLRQEIRRITGVEVREATAEVQATTGTVVQVFSLTHAVPADTWSGSDPGLAETKKEVDRWDDDGGQMSECHSSGTARGRALSPVKHGMVDQGKGETQMKFIDVVAAVVVVVGALNWGMVGLFQYDLVAALLGDATALTRLVYIVVGVAGLYQALQWKAIHYRWVGHRTLMPA